MAEFHSGDEVFGVCEGGSFAEYALARADKLTAKPASLSFEQAAAVPISGLTALQAVRDKAHMSAWQKVLIIGASGGVGTFAVQIAKALGAEVTGVCSTAKVDLVRSIGADHVIDYTREDITDGGRRYDAILDIGGNRRLSQLRRALTHTGRLVIVGGEGFGLLGDTLSGEVPPTQHVLIFPSLRPLSCGASAGTPRRGHVHDAQSLPP